MFSDYKDYLHYRYKNYLWIDIKELHRTSYKLKSQDIIDVPIKLVNEILNLEESNNNDSIYR